MHTHLSRRRYLDPTEHLLLKQGGSLLPFGPREYALLFFPKEALLVDDSLFKQPSGSDEALLSLGFHFARSNIRFIDNDRAQKRPAFPIGIFHQPPQMLSDCVMDLTPIGTTGVRELLITEKPLFLGGLQSNR